MILSAKHGIVSLQSRRTFLSIVALQHKEIRKIRSTATNHPSLDTKLVNCRAISIKHLTHRQYLKMVSHTHLVMVVRLTSLVGMVRMSAASWLVTWILIAEA